MNIKKDDKVVVLSGKDKGKEGKVLVASPKTGKVVVEGVAIATKHQKPRQQGVPGGIVKKEAAIDARPRGNAQPSDHAPATLLLEY